MELALDLGDTFMLAFARAVRLRGKGTMCVRGGRAIQLLLPEAARRSSGDIDLYSTCSPRCVDGLVSESVSPSTPEGRVLVVTAQWFQHPTLTMPIREYVVSNANEVVLTVQVRMVAALPPTVTVCTADGTAVAVLTKAELVAEKMLKFSRHSGHHHESRQPGSYAKHLTDLFFLVTLTPAVNAADVFMACARILDEERIHEGTAPSLLDFMHDVADSLNAYRATLPLCESTNDGTRTHTRWQDICLAQAAESMRNWIKGLTALVQP